MRWGTNDRAKRDPGLVVGGVGMASSGMLVPVCTRLARLGAIEAVEEAETTEAAAQVVQEAEAICWIDEEAGVCSVCKRRRTGQREYHERTAAENRADTRAATSDRHEWTILSWKGMQVSRLVGSREHRVKRASRRWTVAATVLRRVWQIFSGNTGDAILRELCASKRHHSGDCSTVGGSECAEGGTDLRGRHG